MTELSLRPSAVGTTALLLLLLSAAACEVTQIEENQSELELETTAAAATAGTSTMSLQDRLDQYTVVRLTTDLPLSASDRRVIPLLIEAAAHMDSVFWYQAFGDQESLLASLRDQQSRDYVRVNYGPWDRLRGDEPFVDGFGTKPLGANFYPAGATREDVQAAANRDQDILSLYTLVRRDSLDDLTTIPYHVAFQRHHERAAEVIRQAAALADDPGFTAYLEARAEALLVDDYRASDIAWLEMRDNSLDFIVGPIETYEDQLFGAKAAHEAYVLVKDRDWSDRLAVYAEHLPQLQRGLPVPDRYRTEAPGAHADLGAYDVIYYAGDANAGSKTIAVNLPNDEVVQRDYGTRRLQLKNAMRAKFDHILLPIADVLLVPEQRRHVTFDAFFENVMFHEVAHGLGIWTVIDGTGRSVREALRDHASALEEGKADVLGLYMVQSLSDRGELGPAHNLDDSYATFLASIFRSIRFGSSSAHGVANLIRFNYFRDQGAFSRDPSGQYRVHPDRMRSAVDSLSSRILQLQGDGDYEAVAAFVSRYGSIDQRLQEDLDRLASAQIPVDVVFEQGIEYLDL